MPSNARAASVATALAGAGVDDAALLLALVLGRDRAWLIAHDNDEILETDRETFAACCARRRAGEPVAYIVGRASFFGREFAVNRYVLIPRPETEHLIEEALALLRNRRNARICDVGTGSGAIACTLAAEIPDARVDAIDISLEALEIASANAAALGVGDRIEFLSGDLLEPVRDRTYDCIVANLPYVPTRDIAAAPDPVSFEPRLALDGGADGLDAYRRLLAQVAAALRPEGVLLLEAAPPLMATLVRLARDAFPLAAIVVGKDYGARERYVKVEAPS